MAELSRADRPDDREAPPPSFDQGDKPAAFSADPCGGLFAKPDVTLLDHLTAVLELGERLVERHFDQSPLLALRALMACALHDIGKATVDFQAKMCRLRQGIAAGRGQTFPHALAALPFVLAAELLLEESPATALAGDETAHGAAGGALRERRRELPATAAVLAHHSSLHGDLFVGFGLPRYAGGYEEIFRSIWRRLDEAARRLKAHPPIVLPDGERVLALAKELMKDDLSRLLHGFFNASARLIDVLKKKRFQTVRGGHDDAPFGRLAGVWRRRLGRGIVLESGRRKAGAFFEPSLRVGGKSVCLASFSGGSGAGGSFRFLVAGADRDGKDGSAPSMGGRCQPGDLSASDAGDGQCDVATVKAYLRRRCCRAGPWPGFVHAAEIRLRRNVGRPLRERTAVEPRFCSPGHGRDAGSVAFGPSSRTTLGRATFFVQGGGRHPG